MLHRPDVAACGGLEIVSGYCGPRTLTLGMRAAIIRAQRSNGEVPAN